MSGSLLIYGALAVGILWAIKEIMAGGGAGALRQAGKGLETIGTEAGSIGTALSRGKDPVTGTTGGVSGDLYDDYLNLALGRMTEVEDYFSPAETIKTGDPDANEMIRAILATAEEGEFKIWLMNEDIQFINSCLETGALGGAEEQIAKKLWIRHFGYPWPKWCS